MMVSSYDKPLLSVCMITYNHANYIRQAIESILSQKVDFSTELIIGEDCSTDNTRKLCNFYQQKYPHLIRLNLPEKNQGMMKNLIKCLQSCKGKYIAFCEGDDYWIDPFKLQKQINFLEKHPDYSLCCHDALMVYEGKARPPRYFSNFTSDLTIDPDTLLSQWTIPSASMVFRKEIVENMQSWMEDINHGDLLLHLLCMNKGKIWYINQLMSVYRVALEGTSMTAQFRKKQDFLFGKLEFLFSHFDEYSDFQHTEILAKVLDRRRRINRFGKKYKKIGKWAYFFSPNYTYKKITEKFRK